MQGWWRYRCMPVKRGMTKSSGMTEHHDSHYNAKQWQIVNMKMINVWKHLERIAIDPENTEANDRLLNCDYRVGVGLVGCDDKTKIFMARGGVPVRAVARQSGNAVVGRGVDLVCADHDHTAIDKVTPTVHLYPNHPRSLSDSLYVGEEGGPELRVYFIATAEKSDVFHHNYTVLEIWLTSQQDPL